MIPEAAVEAAAKSIYESESDLNKWDWPVAEIDREEYRKHARAALEAAAPHMLTGVEWAVFRSQCGPNESPAENLRYKTRESAQAAIDSGYSQPQYWEPRGRAIGQWAK